MDENIKKPQKKKKSKKKIKPFQNLDKFEFQEIILSNSNRPEDAFNKFRN